MQFDHVIIGGSAGAVSAVEAIRARDKRETIAVIHNEDVPAYSRPLISELLTEEKNLQEILFRDSMFWKKHKIALIHDIAVRIDIGNRQIILEKRQKIEFNQLLLATGGIPIIPRIQGIGDQAYTYTNIADVNRLSSVLSQSNKIVVIGGGLIGVSLSEALAKIGKKVVIVELQERVLSQALDKFSASILQEQMRRAGIQLITGRSVSAVCQRSRKVTKVELDNGDTISCDLVIIAVGVKPNAQLAADAGITVNHGIIVDDMMRTNIPEIYACGDVAEVYDFVHSDYRPLALWSVAMGSGKIAGSNMAGGENRYGGATAMNALKYFNTPIITAGETTTNNSIEVSTQGEKNRYKKFVFKDDTLIGFTLVGDVEQAGLFLYLMKKHIDVKFLKREFCSPDFSLIRLPKRIRAEVLA